jgi:flagellar hook-associated protein 2
MLSIDGLISGLDTTSIIQQLISIERRPINRLEFRIDEANQRKLAFMEVSARLLAMQSNVARLASQNTFRSTAATSSAPDIISVYASGELTAGSYMFRVARLAQSEQKVSTGFADLDTTPVGEGSMTIELGGTFLDSATRIDFLNGQKGISRGKIGVTDRTGNSTTVDLATAVDLQDVVDLINDAPVGVRASVSGDHLVIEDLTSGAGNLSVQEVSGGSTAADLGILKTVAASSFDGDDINFVTGATPLELLNDGRGVRSRAGDDFTITTLSGATIGVDISGAMTLGDVVAAIVNDAENAGKVSATVTGKKLVLTDNTAGGGTFSVTAGASEAAADLGIAGSAPADTITGKDLIPELNTVLLASLNGGRGISSGSFIIHDRSGASDTFDMSSYTTIQDLMDAISGSALISVGAKINAEGNGILLTDGTGLSAGAIKVLENGSTVAAELGILTEYADTFDATTSGTSFTDASLIGLADDYFNGADFVNVTTAETSTVVDFDGSTGTVTLADSLNFNAGDSFALRGVNSRTFSGQSANFGYIGEMTRLETLNGGSGVFAGKFRITDGDGNSATIDLSQADDIYIEDVISEINAALANVTAQINDQGNGIILTDSSAGGAGLRVEEDGGTTAKDLNLLAFSETGFIDGSFRYTVTADANDTLEDLRDKINELDIGVQASIINDGSEFNPYRLNLVSEQPGLSGRMLVDGKGLGIDFSTTSRAQDAAVVFGSTAGGGAPILIESSTNTLNDLVEGMSISLLSASDSPVTITLSRDYAGVVSSVQSFVDGYNGTMDAFATLTQFDFENNIKGVLVGDSSIRRIESSLQRLVTDQVRGLPSGWNRLRTVGIEFSTQGKLTLNESKLRSVIDSDPERVMDLFTLARSLEDTTLLDDFNGGRGVGIVSSGADFEITRRDGVVLTIDLTGAKDLGDVLSFINNNADNADKKLVASISTDGRRIVFEDFTGGAGTLELDALNQSSVIGDLGLSRSATASTMKGREIDLTNNPGIGKRLLDRLDLMTKEDGGLIALATGRLDSQIDIYNERIESIEKHVTFEENRLKRQFTNLEMMLGQSQNLMSWLSQQLEQMQKWSMRTSKK